MTKYTFVIEEENVDERIDKFIASNLNDISRSYVQKLITDSCVLVNEKSCKANYKLSLNDMIVVNIPDLVPLEIKAENIPLDIVFEDDDIVIVNKPKGMVVHPAPGHYTNTLVNALMYHCKDNLSGINGVLRPGIVHRIDMDTTGLLVVCKNDYAHNFIAKQISEHTVTRKYQAIVYNNFQNDEGTINAPIGRHPVDRKRMAIDKNNKREAITHYKVLENLNKFAHIECRLETGRTHQIRVHMSSINHPLLGDETYTNAKSPFNLQGQTLHEKTLGFIHPRTNDYIEFDSELPEYFKNLLNKLRR